MAASMARRTPAGICSPRPAARMGAVRAASASIMVGRFKVTLQVGRAAGETTTEAPADTTGAAGGTWEEAAVSTGGI